VFALFAGVAGVAGVRARKRGISKKPPNYFLNIPAIEHSAGIMVGLVLMHSTSDMMHV
jgi:hypothetical protein